MTMSIAIGTTVPLTTKVTMTATMTVTVTRTRLAVSRWHAGSGPLAGRTKPGALPAGAVRADREGG